jgi:hypothetical protein
MGRLSKVLVGRLYKFPPKTNDKHSPTTSSSHSPIPPGTWNPFAKDRGYCGPPFHWDEERRFLLCCELDAAYFHIYGIDRDDTDYIMETFPIVKCRDEAQFGESRTRQIILEIYEAMRYAITTGEPCRTLLDPPPADPRVTLHDKDRPA